MNESMPGNEVTITSRNPRRIGPEDAEALAKAIRPHLPNNTVTVHAGNQEDQNYGITYFQIISIGLGEIGIIAGRKLIEEVTKSAVEWARERFRKSEKGTPIYIPIYGPDGEVLKSVVVKNPTDDPEDRTEQDNRFRNSSRNH